MMEYEGGHNLFTEHFVIGCLINSNSNLSTLKSVNQFLDFVEKDWGMDKFRNRIQYVSYLNLIELNEFKKVLGQLVQIYKNHFPYSEKDDFIEHFFSYTLFDLERIVSKEYTWLGEVSGNEDFEFYYSYSLNDSEFLFFAVPSDKSIEYYLQYYKRVLKMIEELDFEDDIGRTLVDFDDLVDEINQAFYRLESFMNGTISKYQCYGFNDAFTRLFKEAKREENFNYSNCKLIGEYWKLTEQIRYDFDKGNYDNSDAPLNNDFDKDCNEICYLNWDRVEEFVEFSTPEEKNEVEQKISITSIINKDFDNPNKIQSTSKVPNEKPDFSSSRKFRAKEYALTFIFDIYSKGEQIPTNVVEGGYDAKELKRIGKSIGFEKPDTFYRAVKEIANNFDVNSKLDLQNISKDWLNAVKSLSSNWGETKKYLIEKELFEE